MDWSKAKNILIVAFIVTNILLVFYLSRDLYFGGDMQIISDKYIQDVENHLNENGIKIKGELPKEILSMPILMVRYQHSQPELIAKQLLGENFEKTAEGVYQSEDKIVAIQANKKVIYKNFKMSTIDYGIDEKEAERVATEFLKEHGLYDNNLVMEQVYYGVVREFDEVPLYKLVYHQTYKNRFLGESYVNVYVNYRGVVGMEALLLKTEKTLESKKKIIPATEAVLRKMNDIIQDNHGEILITNIEVGYYFNPRDLEDTDWVNIESGTAFPSWRIILQNGKTYYVEALKN